MKKVLFIFPSDSSFVRIDRELFQKYSRVRNFEFRADTFFRALKNIFRQFLFLLVNGPGSDLIYIWFADYHSFLPIAFGKIFGIKTYLVLGGSDCQYIEKYRIGNIYGPLGIRKYFVVNSMKYAHRLLPVDKCLIHNENKFLPDERIESGVTTLVNSKFDYTVFPTSIRDSWRVGPKENMVLTVAVARTKKRMMLKGLDLLLEVAARMPEIQFVIVGLSDSMKEKSALPENVTSYSFLDQEDLIDLYSRSKVFALFSLYEGLPTVVIEALASGCIPVTSAVSGMTALTEKYGYLVRQKSADEAEAQLRKALEMTSYSPEAISREVKSTFSLSKRDDFIRNLVDENYKVGASGDQAG